MTVQVTPSPRAATATYVPPAASAPGIGCSAGRRRPGRAWTRRPCPSRTACCEGVGACGGRGGGDGRAVEPCRRPFLVARAVGHREAMPIATAATMATAAMSRPLRLGASSSCRRAGPPAARRAACPAGRRPAAGTAGSARRPRRPGRHRTAAGPAGSRTRRPGRPDRAAGAWRRSAAGSRSPRPAAAAAGDTRTALGRLLGLLRAPLADPLHLVVGGAGHAWLSRGRVRLLAALRPVEIRERVVVLRGAVVSGRHPLHSLLLAHRCPVHLWYPNPTGPG